jgi:hypothetical protein
MITPEINGACSATPNNFQGMNRGYTKREDIARSLMAALVTADPDDTHGWKTMAQEAVRGADALLKALGE